jgi:adenosylhomocysteine nucleosidase
MMILPKLAIIAALDRELHSLIKHWPSTTITRESRQFTFYESNYAVAVCGGIGPEAARSAAQAAIITYTPHLLISAGLAGALTPELRAGETIFPAVVIDSQDGSRHQTSIQTARLGNSPLARTVLLSSPQIASAAQKQQFAKYYAAHALDMEAAAVARAAQVHNLPFLAIKSISDELNFELPAISRFIRNGQFRTKAFILHVGLRPWLWLRVFRLARNAKIASENLCAWLRESVLINTMVPGATGGAGGNPTASD